MAIARSSSEAYAHSDPGWRNSSSLAYTESCHVLEQLKASYQRISQSYSNSNIVHDFICFDKRRSSYQVDI